MREFVETITRALVDSPDQVDVREVKNPRSVVFEVSVDGDDVGKVIGRGGKNARALRTLVTAAGAKRGIRAVLKILD